ncbi:MAG: serine protease [Rhodobacteraceae bacterium]|jgi:hypothetical protein|nr:serine protease [Paracoccaceae bacterium]
MQDTRKFDNWSFASFPIQLWFNETMGSSATGSIWEASGRTYLVTNWHNFSGKHFVTKENLSKDTGLHPNRVRVYIPVLGNPVTWIHYEFNLLDEHEDPLWADARDAHFPADLAALSIDLPAGLNCNYANMLPSIDIVTEVGSEVFIIGYPFTYDEVGLPIWKRASLASELANVPPNGRRHILVDTATRSGMSGSLVIRKVTGGYTTESGNMINNGRPGYRLLGVYSGRYGANKDGDAQLGMVWPREMVDDLLKSACERAS